MAARTTTPGTPYAREIWLNASYEGLSSQDAHLASERIGRIGGFRSALTGDDKGAFRYDYRDADRINHILDRARATLRRLGIANPNVTAFVIWRVDLPFGQQVTLDHFAWARRTITAFAGVLAAHMIGSNREGMYVEFYGQPSQELMNQVRRVVAPLTA